MATTTPWGAVAREPALIENRNSKFCAHNNKTIDRNKRQVVCSSKECGAILDPIEVLARLASDGTDLLWAREELRRLNTEIRKLELERSNLKGSVAGLKKRRGL